MNIFQHIESFITTKVWPFLKNVGKAVVRAEIEALEPIATNLVAQAQTKVVQAAASGNLSDLGDVLGDLVRDTAKAAGKAALGAGATSIFTAVGSALAVNPATSESLAVPAPAPSEQPGG